MYMVSIIDHSPLKHGFNWSYNWCWKCFF